MRLSPGQQLDHVQGLQLQPFGICCTKNVKGGNIYQVEEEECFGGSPESVS